MHRIFLSTLILAAASVAHADLSPAPKVAATQVALRDLWTGHVFWVRNYAIAAMSKSPAALNASEEQVVTNARQIADSIEPFYGKPAAEKLFGLLAGHWGAIKAHIEATNKGNKKAQQAALADASKNGDEIATFLSSANPNLPKGALVALLTAHVGHHAAQNQQIKDKQFAAEAKTWEGMRVHMNAIADALAEGIAKQFPDRF